MDGSYRLAQLSARYALFPMQVSKRPTDPADAVMREIEEMGKKSFIPSIGPVKGKILAEVVRKLKPRKILEVGSRSEEHTSELQSHLNLVCRLLLEKKK